MRLLGVTDHTTGKADWETPQWLFDILNEEFHFDVDLCATKKNAKCAKFYTRTQDGLKQEWRGSCWLNPPYGRGVIDKWLKKASESNATIVCLVPSRTGPPWWQQYVMGHASEIRFLAGKLKFVGAKSVAGFCSAIVIFRNAR